MSAFPSPPTPDQEWTHPTTGITYVFDAVNNTWNISYKTATSTGTLPLSNPTSFTLPTSLPDVPGGLLVQAQYNEWLFNALQHVNAEANIEVEPAPGPTDPDVGRLWYNSDTGKLYLYYFDGTSAQWVEIVGGGDVDLSDYATITYSDEEDAKLQAQIDALAVPDLGPPTTVQRLYRFLTTTSLSMGDMYGNSTVPADLSSVSFAAKDSTNQDKPVFSKGDELSIGEFKYRFTDTAGHVEYVSGPAGNIVENNRYSVTFTIYPTGLASRVAEGEETQAQIQETIATALTTQAAIQDQINNLQYTIQTDPLSGFPQIKLVDQDGASSEVHFTATGELSVSQNASSITYGVNLSPYATKVYSDAGDLFLQNQIDNIEIEKGTVATYDCVDTQVGMTNARTGECLFSDATASAVIILGFGSEDKSGNLTHPIANGDIIEVIDPSGTVSRYTCNDNASAPTMVAVTFVSGDQTFSTGTEYSVYIYPQNASGVSKDYVDAQDALKLDLAGGDLTGSLNTDSLIKSTRTSGYAFQVYDEANDTNVAFLHSNGNIRGAQGTFTSDVEIRGQTTFKGVTTFEKNLNFEGAWISGNLGFHTADKGVRYYLDDKATHFADITRKGIVLQNLMYGDNMWTLKVQDSSNANSNTLIYADYSSGLILNEVGELNVKGTVNFDSGTINATSGDPVLSGRASLDIRTAADYPVVISSGSGYKKLVAFYGFDGSQDDNRGEVAYINADGKAHFADVFSNGEPVEIKGNGMRWQHATHTVAADLVAGEFFIADNGNIYLHPTSYDGIDLSVGSTATSVTDIKQLGSVHRANGDSAYHITWNQITYNNGSNKYVRVSKNATHLGDSTTQGEIYRLNIPGFTY